MKNVKSFLAKNFLILAFAIVGIFAVTSNVTVSGNNLQQTGTNPGNLYQSQSYCGGWTIKICCTYTQKAHLCTRYDLDCPIC